MKMLVIGDPGTVENARLKQEAKKLGHRVDVTWMEELSFDTRRGKSGIRYKKLDVLKTYDVIYFRLFSPYYSEALMLAEWAAAAGIRVIESRLAESKYVHSKMYDYWKLAQAELPIPESFQSLRLSNALSMIKGGKWPKIAKGIHGLKGRYVFRTDSLAHAKKHLTEDLVGFFIFQEYLDVEAEYRVLVLGGKAIGTMRKSRPEGDFRHNMALGAVGGKVDLPKKLLRMCEKAAKVLEREFAGVDLAIVAGKPYILEVNRRPGFKAFEEATGINVAKTFITYVAQDRHRRPAQRR